MNENKKNKSAIILKNIWKTYWMGSNKIDVLKGINLDIKKGSGINYLLFISIDKTV